MEGTMKYRLFRTMLPALLFQLFLFLNPAVATKASEPIMLKVDASEIGRRILHVSETISTEPGPLSLCFAKWIPGEHGPTGPVADLVGLKIKSEDKVLNWQRDLVDMYSVILEIPTGIKRIDLSFDFLLSPETEGFSSAASSTSQLGVISWNQVVIYPGNQFSDSIIISPSMILPEGWQFGTALETKSQTNNAVDFLPVSLTKLVDSPVLTGHYFKKIDITPASGIPHHLDLAADNDEEIDMPQWQIEAYKHLILEANSLFGARHYNHYDFLVSLSSKIANFGLEHHQSSDDRMPEKAITDSSYQRAWAALLSHEYAHSWNGKFRRPIGLATHKFSDAAKTDLLWVYEGFTTYLGEILAARAGIESPEDFRETLALLAARLNNLPGRTWRSLQDVSNSAQILYGAREDWQSLRRGVDFYDESYLIWLEADVLIRQMSNGKKSLDDFCKQFYGGENSGPLVIPYTYNDVVFALNKIIPYDWNAFFDNRLDSLNSHAPLGGIEHGGWKLVYRETPGGLQEANENNDHTIDARYSIGLYLSENGDIKDIIPGFPAAEAGLAPGMNIVAINGRKFSKEVFRNAMKEAKSSSSPMGFLIDNCDFFSTYLINYHGGERYPVLGRDNSKPDILKKIITPIASANISRKPLKKYNN
jgi:predicted metalloprotease with PDZ domain